MNCKRCVEDNMVAATRLTVAAIFSVMALSPTETKAQVDTGNDLLQFCGANSSNSSMFLDGICSGFISGVISLAAQNVNGSAIKLCLPERVNNGQIRDVVVAYVKAHPENRHWPSSILVISALNDAFCGK